MNQKQAKPTLTGQRIKTRKRDEKEKYEPSVFSDAVIQGLNETQGDLEQVSSFLDKSGSRLDYRRYAETLFDVLFAGGILAPGGSLVGEGDKSEVCVFAAQDNLEHLKQYTEVFHKLMRRYKYLEKPFIDEVKKILMFLKGFSDSERSKLAKITSLFLVNNMVQADVLNSLLGDHLIKEGLALQFVIELFQTWLGERDINHVSGMLRKASMDNKLIKFLPVHKQDLQHFSACFNEAGLQSIVSFQASQLSADNKREMKSEVKQMIKDEAPIKEIINYCKEGMKKNGLNESEVIILLWKCLMAVVEWNKKEELIGEQTLKHLKIYTPLLAAFTTQGKSEVALMLKIQEYCYDNMNFMKVFQKTIVLLYKADVLSEDAVIKWYKEAHLSKGKSVFLEQMKGFVEWLQHAEEESDSDEED